MERVEEKRQAGIEVTDEMVSAGREALWRSAVDDPILSDQEDAVVEIFVAMTLAGRIAREGR